jgi:hypothetical protein
MIALFSSIRASLLSEEEAIRRRDLNGRIELVKLISKVAIIALAALACLSFSAGQHLAALLYLPLAYAAYEIHKIAENVQKILEHPVEEAETFLLSPEHFGRYLTKGTPIARSLLLLSL